MGAAPEGPTSAGGETARASRLLSSARSASNVGARRWAEVGAVRISSASNRLIRAIRSVKAESRTRLGGCANSRLLMSSEIAVSD